VIVRVPADVDVTGTLSSEMGDVSFLDQQQEGHNAHLNLNDLGTDGKAGPQQVTLDLDVRLGSIKVERG
jgi:predicted membrane protein